MVSSRSSVLTGVTSNDIVANNDNTNSSNNNNNNGDQLRNSSSPIESSTIETSAGLATAGIELRSNDKNALSFGTKERRITEESEKKERSTPASEDSRSQSGPSSLVSNLVSRCSSIEGKGSNNNCNLAGQTDGDYGDEESYEGFGYARTNDGDLEVDVDVTEADGDGGLGGDSSSSAPSPTGPNSLTLKSSSPSSTIGRHSWLRTSLRRTPPCMARQRQLSSNALASQLYRSGSFNSSGRGSTCDAADDMYSDVSLEDDVIDLNHRVRMIQEQMHVLTDTHSVGEERYARAKQENATLQARILMLEEAAKDAEARAEEKLQVEQRRHREWACRLEREKQLQLENYAIKMQTIELESSSLRDQVARLREQLDSAREERSRMENVIDDLRREVTDVREAERQALLRSNEARVVLDAAKEELAVRNDDRLKLEELTVEVAQLRARNKSLEESRDELQAAAALHAGRELLFLNLPRSGYDTLDAADEGGGACSLAVELSADVLRDRNSLTRQAKQPLTMAEMKQALKEQQEVNTQLRSYIDGILLNIVENYPQLLEVKQANG